MVALKAVWMVDSLVEKSVGSTVDCLDVLWVAVLVELMVVVLAEYLAALKEIQKVDKMAEQ